MFFTFFLASRSMVQKSSTAFKAVWFGSKQFIIGIPMKVSDQY